MVERGRQSLPTEREDVATLPVRICTVLHRSHRQPEEVEARSVDLRWRVVLERSVETSWFYPLTADIRVDFFLRPYVRLIWHTIFAAFCGKTVLFH